jgi:hypothetical protein
MTVRAVLRFEKRLRQFTLHFERDVSPRSEFDEFWPSGTVTDIGHLWGPSTLHCRMRRNETIHKAKGCLPPRLILAVLGLAAAAGTAQAGEIYKSVDANGKVVYSDHLDPSLSQSSLVQLDDPGLPPSQLHFCWTNCFTLILDNGAYRRSDDPSETWTVETFSADVIVLHRHDAPADWNGYSADVVYAGQVSNDRLIGVTVNGKPTSGIDFSWGSALNSLPGSNAERDGKTAAIPDSAPVASVSSATPPPPLPEEDQPPLPDDGLLWTPGYWYWRDRVYVWVPGLWTRPPRVGVLWTPGYWSMAGAVFVFHPGYWGPTVGFYGAVNYGHGYFGNGYTGGHWIGNSFAYNSAVNHLDAAVAHHTYAQSAAGQTPRGVQSYSAEASTGASNHAASQARSPAVTVNKTATATRVDQTGETTSTPKTIEKPANVVKAPPGSASPKSTRVTQSRPTPIKQ